MKSEARTGYLIIIGTVLFLAACAGGLRYSGRPSSPSKLSSGQRLKAPLDLSWDILGLYNNGIEASRTYRGDSTRLRAAIARANVEKRPLRVGFIGGSFAAGAGVRNMKYAFSNQLIQLLSNTTELLDFGAKGYNIAQGASFQTVPLLCMEPVLKIATNGEDLLPDVYVVEFVVNLSDQTADTLLALVGSLLYSPSRSNGSAVILGAVIGNECLRTLKFNDPPNCYYELPYSIHAEVARRLGGVPFVSFFHGLVPSIRGAEVNSSGLFSVGYVPKKRVLQRAGMLTQFLYGMNGQDLHFNEYGHRLFAHFLFGPFLDAGEHHSAHLQVQEDSLHSILSTDVSRILSLPPRALSLLSRLSAPDRSLSCRLTITQNAAPDLIPTKSSGYSLQLYSGPSGKSFAMEGELKRKDIKRAYAPDRVGAEMVLDQAFGNAEELCLMSFGDTSMIIGVEVVSGSTNFTCSFRAGVAGLDEKLLYWMECCGIPHAARGGNGTVKMRAEVGLAQVAGLAVF